MRPWSRGTLGWSPRNCRNALWNGRLLVSPPLRTPKEFCTARSNGAACTVGDDMLLPLAPDEQRAAKSTRERPKGNEETGGQHLMTAVSRRKFLRTAAVGGAGAAAKTPAATPITPTLPAGRGPHTTSARERLWTLYGGVPRRAP